MVAALIVVSYIGGAQIVDADTITVIDNEELVEEHSPKKAAIYSAVLPGWGQAYNKKYWKIPIIYAGFGTIGYFIYWNNDNYKTYKLAYNDLTDGNPNEGSHLDLVPDWIDLDNPSDYESFRTALIKSQDYYRRNRDLLIIGMVGFYGLNIIDASVDAHLFNFDISEDLSMNWQPTMQSINYQTVYGFNCTFTF
jgi:hypothetical protein